MLTAKERDLAPLLQDSAETLDLDEWQLAEMERFLDSAWFYGIYTSHAKFRQIAMEQAPRACHDLSEAPEIDLEALLLESADTLNLPGLSTLFMWDFLRQALCAGIRTHEREIMAGITAVTCDVAEEAMRWLEEQGPD